MKIKLILSLIAISLIGFLSFVVLSLPKPIRKALFNNLNSSEICGGYDYDYVPIYGESNTNLTLCHTGSMCDINYANCVAKYVENINELKVGDIILYTYDCTKNPLDSPRCEDVDFIHLTHRIIDIDYQSKLVKPKGDCNSIDDGWIDFDVITYVIRDKQGVFV